MASGLLSPRTLVKETPEPEALRTGYEKTATLAALRYYCMERNAELAQFFAAQLDHGVYTRKTDTTVALVWRVQSLSTSVWKELFNIAIGDVGFADLFLLVSLLQKKNEFDSQRQPEQLVVRHISLLRAVQLTADIHKNSTVRAATIAAHDPLQQNKLLVVTAGASFQTLLDLLMDETNQLCNVKWDMEREYRATVLVALLCNMRNGQEEEWGRKPIKLASFEKHRWLTHLFMGENFNPDWLFKNLIMDEAVVGKSSSQRNCASIRIIHKLYNFINKVHADVAFLLIVLAEIALQLPALDPVCGIYALLLVTQHARNNTGLAEYSQTVMISRTESNLRQFWKKIGIDSTKHIRLSHAYIPSTEDVEMREIEYELYNIPWLDEEGIKKQNLPSDNDKQFDYGAYVKQRKKQIAEDIRKQLENPRSELKKQLDTVFKSIRADYAKEFAEAKKRFAIEFQITTFDDSYDREIEEYETPESMDQLVYNLSQLLKKPQLAAHHAALREINQQFVVAPNKNISIPLVVSEFKSGLIENAMHYIPDHMRDASTAQGAGLTKPRSDNSRESVPLNTTEAFESWLKVLDIFGLVNQTTSSKLRIPGADSQVYTLCQLSFGPSMRSDFVPFYTPFGQYNGTGENQLMPATSYGVNTIYHDIARDVFSSIALPNSTPRLVGVQPNYPTLESLINTLYGMRKSLRPNSAFIHLPHLSLQTNAEAMDFTPAPRLRAIPIVPPAPLVLPQRVVIEDDSDDDSSSMQSTPNPPIGSESPGFKPLHSQNDNSKARTVSKFMQRRFSDTFVVADETLQPLSEKSLDLLKEIRKEKSIRNRTASAPGRELSPRQIKRKADGTKTPTYEVSELRLTSPALRDEDDDELPSMHDVIGGSAKRLNVYGSHENTPIRMMLLSQNPMYYIDPKNAASQVPVAHEPIASGHNVWFTQTGIVKGPYNVVVRDKVRLIKEGDYGSIVLLLQRFRVMNQGFEDTTLVEYKSTPVYDFDQSGTQLWALTANNVASTSKDQWRMTQKIHHNHSYFLADTKTLGIRTLNNALDVIQKMRIPILYHFIVYFVMLGGNRDLEKMLVSNGKIFAIGYNTIGKPIPFASIQAGKRINRAEALLSALLFRKHVPESQLLALFYDIQPNNNEQPDFNERDGLAYVLREIAKKLAENLPKAIAVEQMIAAKNNGKNPYSVNLQQRVPIICDLIENISTLLELSSNDIKTPHDEEKENNVMYEAGWRFEQAQVKDLGQKNVRT